MDQSTQIIANTVLKWDAPQHETVPVETVVDKISGWHAAAKSKVESACKELESHGDNTAAVIALHKALMWIDEAEGWAQSLLQH